MSAALLYMFVQTLLASHILGYVCENWSPDFHADYPDYHIPMAEHLDFLRFITPVTQIYPIPFLMGSYGVSAAEDDMACTKKTVLKGVETFDGIVQASGTVSIVGQSDGFGQTHQTAQLTSPMVIPITFPAPIKSSAVSPFVDSHSVSLLSSVKFPSVPIPSVALPSVVLSGVTPSGSIPTIATSSLPTPFVATLSVFTPFEGFPSTSKPSPSSPSLFIPSLGENNKLDTGISAINGIPFEGVVPASGKVTISGRFGPDGNGYFINDFQTPRDSVAYPPVDYHLAFPYVAYPSTVIPSVDCQEVMEFNGAVHTNGIAFSKIVPAYGKVTIVGRF